MIKKGSTNLPPQGISTPTTPQTEAPTEVAEILDPLHSYVSVQLN